VVIKQLVSLWENMHFLVKFIHQPAGETSYFCLVLYFMQNKPSTIPNMLKGYGKKCLLSYLKTRL